MAETCRLYRQNLTTLTEESQLEPVSVNEWPSRVQRQWHCLRLSKNQGSTSIWSHGVFSEHGRVLPFESLLNYQQRVAKWELRIEISLMQRLHTREFFIPNPSDTRRFDIPIFFSSCEFPSNTALDEFNPSRDVKVDRCSSTSSSSSTDQQEQQTNQLDFSSVNVFPRPSFHNVFELDQVYTIGIQGSIGKGYYGKVYKGYLLHFIKQVEPKKVAVKKLKSNTKSSISDLRDFRHEIKAMKTLTHPNIVSIEGVIEEHCLFIMEYCPEGSLKDFIKDMKKIQNKSLLNRCKSRFMKYALDIASGMEYLSRKGIVHRDLAARNILVVNESTVKVSDFGLARFTRGNHHESIHTYDLKTNRALPIQWCAPEVIPDPNCPKEVFFSEKSDVWSFGVTIWEIFSFCDEPSIIEPVLKKTMGEYTEVYQLSAVKFQEQQRNLLIGGKRLPCPVGCPKEIYKNFMESCWSLSPKDRPSFRKLVHEIINYHRKCL